MKAIRSFTQNPLTIAVLLLAFLNLSCNQDDFVENYVDNSLINKYSGEEIFKSIIFADGILTKEIVPLANQHIAERMNASQLEEYRNLQKEAINYISGMDREFFTNFKNDILSKNPHSINNALEKAGNLLVPFIQEKLKINNISYEEVYSKAQEIEIYSGAFTDSQLGKTKSSDVCIYGAVVIAIVAAAVVALVVVGFGFWWAKPGTDTPGNSLLKDEIILQIVNL